MGRILIGKVTHPLKDNLETPEPGQGSLDAHQGKVLKGLIGSLGLDIGDLTALQTTDKDNLVNAINNLVEAVSTLNGNMTLSSGSLTQGTDSWTNSQRTIWQKSGNILHLSGVIKANTNSNSIALGGLPLSGRTISGSAQCIVYCSNNTSGGNQYYVATMSKKNDTELVINLPENVASGDFISFDFEVVLYRLS